MPSESELQKRIRELEAENARLKSKSSQVVEYKAREDSYEGHPILVFERQSGRSFSLGLSKLQAVRACWHTVEEFLRRHGNGTAAHHLNDDKI